MGRIRRGWELTKKSWAILREHRELIRFPLYGGVLATVVTLVMVGPGLFFIEDDLGAVGIPLAILGLYLATVVGFYFSVGLAASADQLLDPAPVSGGGEAVLRAAGASPVPRDDFDVRNFPDDVYGLSPATFADVDPALHEPGLVWGAAKAHVHLARRRREGKR